MSRPWRSFRSHTGLRYAHQSTQGPARILHIDNGTFYHHHPDTTPVANPPLFRGLSFELAWHQDPQKHWAIVGPSSSGKTTLLNVLRGDHICIPPNARSFPHLEKAQHGTSTRRLPSQVIKYVGFEGKQRLGSGAPQSAYLSARYESRREITDFTLKDYLLGNTELNPWTSDEDETSRVRSTALLERVVRDLRLGELLHMPVTNLSNGQTRRARIAQALLSEPEVLLLDEPFMGLDPRTLLALDPMLGRLAEKRDPRIVLALRPQDRVPEWITHVVRLRGHCEVEAIGKKEVIFERRCHPSHTEHRASAESEQVIAKDTKSASDRAAPPHSEALIEMQGVHVQYGDKCVLGQWQQQHDGEAHSGLWWTIRRGERWGVFGSNGSGKTTLLSLICSDHPQTYSLPVRIFGRSRIPEPGQMGISIFDIQARIGHSSPEIHNHIPRSLSLMQVLQSAWASTFHGVPRLDGDASARIRACLCWFEADLRPKPGRAIETSGSTDVEWASDVLFHQLPFAAQRVALFLRAIIKSPDIVILDEAFSGMDDRLRDNCMLFLAHGETKTYDVREAVSQSESSEHHEDQSQTTISQSPPRHHTSPRSIFNTSSTAQRTIVFKGLTTQQALVCISHVPEEVPDSIRDWVCLPEANTGQPARFGRLGGPLDGDGERWAEIWGGDDAVLEAAG